MDPGVLFLKNLSGRPAGQPTMYLASPIHFGGILCVWVYILDILLSMGSILRIVCIFLIMVGAEPNLTIRVGAVPICLAMRSKALVASLKLSPLMESLSSMYIAFPTHLINMFFGPFPVQKETNKQRGLGGPIR